MTDGADDATDGDSVKFTCQLCGKMFDPVPDSMIEWEFGPELISENESGPFLTEVDLIDMDEDDLREMGLSAKDRDRALQGETIKLGGCICLECQDSEFQEV